MNNNTSNTSLTNYGVKALSKLLSIALVITLTNGFVFVLFCRRPRLRTSSNYLLLSLAVCDFFTGVINIPYFIIFSFEDELRSNLSFWMYVLHTLMAVSAAYHILTVVAEKYFAIIRPLRHYLITKKTIFKILAGIWIMSALYAVIPITWNGSTSRNFWYIIHATVGLVFVFFVPYTLMIYAFTIMFRAIAERERPTSVRAGKIRQEQKNINDRKCIFVFAIMAAIFAICWLPYFTVMLVYYDKYYRKSNDFSSIDKAAEVFTIVRYVTSVFNPLLYTFFKRDFWLALRTLCFKREPCFSLESKSGLRSKRWRSRRSTSSSTKSYLVPENTRGSRRSTSSGTKSYLVPENTRGPDMSRQANNLHNEQIIYVTSV